MLQNGNRIEIKGRFQKRIYIKYDIRKKFVCQMINCFIFRMVICHIVVPIGVMSSKYYFDNCQIISVHRQIKKSNIRPLESLISFARLSNLCNSLAFALEPLNPCPRQASLDPLNPLGLHLLNWR